MNEQANIKIVHAICDILEIRSPRRGGKSYREQITCVTDRPGYDRRYAIDCSKIEGKLGWRPAESFATL